jgi:ArsR family transcriptional regulator, arsenate/arsenite/antimonite-responsive transcriptional repressor
MKSAALASIGHLDQQTEGKLSAPHALAALAALGQPTRLEILRLLMRREPKGLAAGSIAAAIGCPQNTLSTHLAILTRAGLTFGTRAGRSIIYRADIQGMRALVQFLVSDCCSGHPQLCNLGNTDLGQGCNPGAKAKKRTSGK